ncbi:MAG: GntR family transcriptional regulator [Gammaproteobacteria bacterium]|nr:GntR family transcriptional regulator [Gammaproteobacteria bacterium]
MWPAPGTTTAPSVSGILISTGPSRWKREPVSSGEAADKALSQTTRALLALRELILSGELKSGDRLSELALVERLGVSRTPVRAALMRLAEEGLVAGIPSGGFAVRAFTEGDVFDAIEIRGTLEGLAARFAAERGVSTARLAAVRACLTEIDELISRPKFTAEIFNAYVALNARFHAMLNELADSAAVMRHIERAVAAPFASPNAFVLAQSLTPVARTVLIVAQEQHRAVIEAIEQREGARAEALMREHAKLAARNLRSVGSLEAQRLVPGGTLIRWGGQR